MSSDRLLNKTIGDDVSIWLAVRATSAAPDYFEPIEIGPAAWSFGGRMEANNPVFYAFATETAK